MNGVSLGTSSGRWSAAAWLVSIVVAVTGCAGSDDPPPDRLRQANVCEYREGGSRWATDASGVEMRAEYGREEGQALADVWGMAATSSGHVLVFDAGNTRVLELDGDLERVRVYGREGTGPGEFVYQRAPHGDWLVADSGSFFVLHYRGVSEFALGAGFVRTVAPGLFDLPEIGRLALWDGRLVYATNLVDTEDGTRVVETRRIEDGASSSLLRGDPMPTLPRWQGRYVRGMFVDQAEPLWALHGRCAFVSDGAGDWILRVDLATNRADTLPLPAREVPERTPEDRRRMDQLRARGSRIGIVTGSADVEPTARVKWTDVRVDPDGFVWLEPWRPYSMRDDPLEVWVIDPARGRVHTVRVDAFPGSFLPDGAFVSLIVDRTISIPVIRKYGAR